mgnify:FL=1|tara:strand:+ start:101 stop:286 length:186 start_codon:yes stop_codon:yes gene_type:complete
MDKVIALRFDNLKEISTVKTLLEIGLADLEVSPGDAIIGRQIIEQLNKCSKLMQKQNGKNT